MTKGIIIKGVGGSYTVYFDGDEFDCRPRGIFRKKGIKPLPGDYVLFEVDENGQGYISEILSRKNSLTRPAVANVDLVVIVVSISYPEPDFYLVDKIMATCFVKGIKPVICANKTDEENPEITDMLKDNYTPTGVKIIYTSAVENTGMDKLKSCFNEKTVVFAGQSGTGKSALLNNIMGKETMKTGEISSKIDRGKHTTRHTNFFISPEGAFIADTPGFSNVEPHGIDEKDLQYYYPEFDNYIGKCKYPGCVHINEPKCKVKDALADGKIGENRHKNYKRIYDKLIEIKKRERGY